MKKNTIIILVVITVLAIIFIYQKKRRSNKSGVFENPLQNDITHPPLAGAIGDGKVFIEKRGVTNKQTTAISKAGEKVLKKNQIVFINYIEGDKYYTNYGFVPKVDINIVDYTSTNTTEASISNQIISNK